MKTNTREDIFWFIQEHNPVSIADIKNKFQISSQIIHRHVKKLFEDDRVYKVWNPPRVFYFVTQKEEKQILTFSPDQSKLLDDHFVNFAANGVVTYGGDWFVSWCNKRDLDPKKEISIYEKTLAKYSYYKDRDWFIEGTQKMIQTFDTVALSKVYYLDFYSIEKYGKTLLWNLMLYAKQTNNKQLAEETLCIITDKIHTLISRDNIDAFAFIPPSIDRKVQLMDELNTGLALPLKELNLIKIFKDKPVPQKSLSKKSDRIQNASQTIFIRDNTFSSDTLLLIDDAVWSWATLNETAKKIIAKWFAKRVIGLAIVWSYKWFEVINEV